VKKVADRWNGASHPGDGVFREFAGHAAFFARKVGVPGRQVEKGAGLDAIQDWLDQR
jgi:hypothetical protein